MKVLGLMSGTSLDGIDAAVVEVTGGCLEDFQWELLCFQSYAYSRGRRDRIARCIESGTPGTISALHVDLGEWFAEAALEAIDSAGLKASEIDLIASHGQTIWHIPPGEPFEDRFLLETPRGASLQLGDPATIAERTGVDVVADFRARDLAAGGHGAPLVPWLDRLLFRLEDRGRCLQNLGGIGNVTWLPPRSSGAPALAFDTGPGNGLMDIAATIASSGTERFDRDGAMAAAGTVRPEIVDAVLCLPFFEEVPPRSTGRELFSPALVRRLAKDIGIDEETGSGRRAEAWSDLLASLCEVTARSVSDAYRRWLPADEITEVVITGGGAQNPHLLERIRVLLDPIPVVTGEVLGVHPDAKEALAFALLGWAHHHGLAGNLPEVTGARRPVIMGSRTPGSAPQRTPHA